jgi:predicted DNA-binding transcriptional regulator AlpA
MGEPIAIPIAECAARMCVTRKHVYHLINTDPTFPQPFKVGGCTRILRAELEEWLANKAKQAREMKVARQAGQAQKREAVRMTRTSGPNAISAGAGSLLPLAQHKEVEKRPSPNHPAIGE